VVDPVTVPDVAVIVVDPAATELASPLAPIVATDVLDEFQDAEVVRFCVESSENVPVAVNCCVVVMAMLGLAGVMAMDTRVGPFTSPTASRRIRRAHPAVVFPSPNDSQQADAAGVTESSPTAICSAFNASTAVTLPSLFKSQITVAIPDDGKATAPSKANNITRKICNCILANKSFAMMKCTPNANYGPKYS
jgi:hypothetical protein